MINNNEDDLIFQEGISSLIGHYLTTILIGNSLYLLYFSPYIYKQLLEIEDFLPEKYIYLFIGIVIFFSNLSNLSSNYFLKGINIRLIILITYLLLLSSHTIFYYSSYSLLIIIGFVFYGIGNGISYYPLIENSERFFPEYKNIINLFNLFIYSLSPLLFHFISNKIMSNNQEIGVKKVIKLEIILYLIFGILSFLFTFDSNEIIKKNNNIDDKFNEVPLRNIRRINTNNKEEESSTGDSKRDSLVSGNSINTLNTNIHNLIGRDDFSNEEDKLRKFSINLKKVLKSKNFYIICFYYFSTLLSTFGLLFEIKKNLSIYLLMISLFRFLSPFISNIINGKILSGFCLFLQYFIFNVFNDSNQNKTNLIVLFSGIFYGINSTIISSIIPKIYGYDLSFYLSGIIIVFGSFSFWFVFTLKFYIKNHLIFVYQIFTIIALVLLFFINETVFNYKISKNQELNNIEVENEEHKNYDAFSINDVKSERDI